MRWIFLAATAALAVSVQAGPYPVEEERQKVLADLERIESQQITISTDGLEGRPREERAFLDYYLNKVLPIKLERRRDAALADVLTTAIDRALYRDEEEKRRWMERKGRLRDSVSATMASDGWIHKVRTLVGLSRGLRGELPSWARRALRNGIITPRELPLIQRNNAIDIEIAQVANDSSVSGEDLAEHAKESAAIERDFRSGDIDLEEAQRRVDSLWPKSRHAKGYDVWKRGRELFDEKAVVATRLARLRGFSNWADYSLSLRNHTHRRGLRSAEDHGRFLTRLLEETHGPAERLHRSLLRQAGRSEDVDRKIVPLIYPEADALLREYFPADKVDGMWDQTMRESGFGDFAFGQISFDSFPRQKKFTHAYMSPSLSNIPKTIAVKPGGLALDVPPLSPDAYHPGLISVVQNVDDDGVFPYEIVFHEGGHALDFAYRENTSLFTDETVFLAEESYAYTETASMMMQRFFDDGDFLLAKGRTREGLALDEGRVRRFLQARAVHKLINMRRMSLHALFDILVWSEPYGEGGPSFSERFLEVYQEVSDKYSFGRSSLPEAVAEGHAGFGTPHFYSGQVLYHGYVYADIAAQMEADHLWSTLAEKTGRRSFLRQPSLAGLLIDGHYKRGFAKPFPSATEEMTGKRFRPRQFADAFRRSVEDFLASSGDKNCRSLASPLF